MVLPLRGWLALVATRYGVWSQPLGLAAFDGAVDSGSGARGTQIQIVEGDDGDPDDSENGEQRDDEQGTSVLGTQWDRETELPSERGETSSLPVETLRPKGPESKGSGSKPGGSRGSGTNEGDVQEPNFHPRDPKNPVGGEPQRSRMPIGGAGNPRTHADAGSVPRGLGKPVASGAGSACSGAC